MIFSIIVPVYNEQNTILKVLEELNDLKFTTFKKEIIVINDGSTDETSNLLNANKHLFDKLYSNDVNKGKGAAVKIGLEKCNGSHIVFHDADLEYDPIDLIKFERLFIKFKADGIIGSRFTYDKYTRSHSILNRFGNFILTFIFNILYDKTFTDIYSCYFAFDKNLLNPKNLRINGFAQHAEILSKVVRKGSKFYEVPVNYNGRNSSEGKKIKFYHFFPVLLEIFLGRFR